MQAIRCELCGSSDIMKQEGFYICQNCKTKYSVEEAMKLIGVVKIDKSEDIENLLTLARRNYENRNYDESDKYYELALREAPNNWEAAYFHTYFNVKSTYPTHPAESLTELVNNTSLALEYIPQQLDAEQQHSALSTLVNLNSNVLCDIIKCIEQYGNNYVQYQKSFELIRHTSELYIFIENLIKSHFPDDKELLYTTQKTNYDILKYHPDPFPRRERRELLKRLKAEMKK